VNHFFGAAILSLLSLLNVCSTDCLYTPEVREPFFAGSFYNEDANQLQMEIVSYLQDARSTFSEVPRIIVVPHAGYSYSWMTAAYAFRTLANSDVERVILIGASHNHNFDYIALDDRLAYRTPIGDVPVDLAFVNTLAASDSRIWLDHAVHDEEHSLEVQLPFLQTLLPEFSIVPIYLSSDDGTLSSLLAEKLKMLIDDKTVVIVSTDLSHYPPQDIALQADEQIIESIRTLDVASFDQQVSMLSAQYNLSTRACGAKAVRSAMLLANELGLTGTVIDYSHSGMLSGGDPSRVVGYGAIVFGEPEEETFEFSLTPEEQKEAIMIARKTLESYLVDGTIPDIFVSGRSLLEPLGAFVTLNKSSGELRGCMGQFISDGPLGQAIQDKAITAAVSDPRFLPVTRSELDDLTIEISVLSPMRRISSPDEIEMGKHGVYIKQGDKSGTYLPQVAEQFNYNKEAFMNSLAANKAGIDMNSWKDGSAELYVYTAYVFEEE
jgi:AmmeMemoRadiSam system protein B/AmmeMemoRadiSam system protein A